MSSQNLDEYPLPFEVIKETGILLTPKQTDDFITLEWQGRWRGCSKEEWAEVKRKAKELLKKDNALILYDD